MITFCAALLHFFFYRFCIYLMYVCLITLCRGEGKRKEPVLLPVVEGELQILNT